MKVLLVNPNSYRFPPVPPIGLEYLAGSLVSGGHETEILDLCFSENIYEETDAAIYSFRPDITGITVRNIDSALYINNEFFLDEIKKLISHIRTVHGLKVIVGGAGTCACPEEILGYLGADFLVSGPAEQTIHEVLNQITHLSDKKIFKGYCKGTMSFTRYNSGVNYRKYIENGGIAGFETHKGCSSSCAYCIEANSKVWFRQPSDVVREIKTLVDAGCSHFHLCDSEFNENLDYCLEFCTVLKNEKPDIKWAAYMKPENFNRRLFTLMKETGVYLATLSVDTYKKCNMYWADIERFIFGAKAAGLRVAVDLLTGFPYEKEEETRQHLENIRRPMPDSVGVNTYIRLYKNTRISRIVSSDRNLDKYLTGHINDNHFLKPVFYNHLSMEQLGQIIDSDSIFRIEGLEKGVNYSRAQDNITLRKI